MWINNVTQTTSTLSWVDFEEVALVFVYPKWIMGKRRVTYLGECSIILLLQSTLLSRPLLAGVAFLNRIRKIRWWFAALIWPIWTGPYNRHVIVTFLNLPLNAGLHSVLFLIAPLQGVWSCSLPPNLDHLHITYSSSYRQSFALVFFFFSLGHYFHFSWVYIIRSFLIIFFKLQLLEVSSLRK